MNLIENLNTMGMCNEQTCSRPASEYELVHIRGLWIMVSCCSKHAEMWEENKKR